jgi:hypothetical protein
MVAESFDQKPTETSPSNVSPSFLKGLPRSARART